MFKSPINAPMMTTSDDTSVRASVARSYVQDMAQKATMKAEKKLLNQQKEMVAAANKKMS